MTLTKEDKVEELQTSFSYISHFIWKTEMQRDYTNIFEMKEKNAYFSSEWDIVLSHNLSRYSVRNLPFLLFLSVWGRCLRSVSRSEEENIEKI